MKLHNRIKFHREKRGLTQENVAMSLGIKVPNYAKYESGERNPKRDRLEQIANILGTDIFALETGFEKEFPGYILK